MPRGHSRDLRERLLRAEASGVPAVEIRRGTGSRPNSIGRWQRKQAGGESLEPGRAPGRRRSITPDEEPVLRTQVAAHPDATLAAHGAEWVATGHPAVSLATMSRAFSRLGLPLKKEPDCHGAR